MSRMESKDLPHGGVESGHNTVEFKWFARLEILQRSSKRLVYCTHKFSLEPLNFRTGDACLPTGERRMDLQHLLDMSSIIK